MSVPRRSVRRGLASALAVAATTVASFTTPAVWTASGVVAAGAARADCVSMRNVRALTGTVTLALGATATGTDPSSSGSETVYLSSAAKHVTVSLDRSFTSRFNGHVLVVRHGVVRGGTVTVDDSVENSGLDMSAEVKANGAVDGGSIHGTAVLAIDRSVCEYKLLVAFHGMGTFSGDTQVADGQWVSWSAQSRVLPVPASLNFHGSETPKVVAKCPDLLEASLGSCAELGGPWLVDLISLDQCGSIDHANCTPNDETALASAAATFSWHLKPVFKRGKR